jgi:hypothetical protein
MFLFCATDAKPTRPHLQFADYQSGSALKEKYLIHELLI